MISICRKSNLLEIKDLDISLYLEYLIVNNLNGIRINDADGFVGESLVPYCSSKDVKRLNFSLHYNLNFKYECIERMDWLTYLVLTIGFDDNYKFNFNNLVNLELLSIDWNKNLLGLENLNKLKSVHFGKFKGEPDLFESYQDMEDFGLTQGNIKNLDFMRHFKKLKKLYLAYIPSLQDASGLQFVYDTVEEIDIEACNNLDLENHLSNFKQLKKLKYNSRKGFQSLGWAKNLSKLEFLAISDTLVMDGDFAPVKDVKYVSMTNKKHYNYFFNQKDWSIQPITAKSVLIPKAQKVNILTMDIPHFGSINIKKLEQDYETDMELKDFRVNLELHFEEEKISKTKLKQVVKLLQDVEKDNDIILTLFKKDFQGGGVVKEYFDYFTDEVDEVKEGDFWQTLLLKRIAFYPHDDQSYGVYDYGIDEINPYVLSLKVNAKGKITGCEMES